MRLRKTWLLGLGLMLGLMTAMATGCWKVGPPSDEHSDFAPLPSSLATVDIWTDPDEETTRSDARQTSPRGTSTPVSSSQAPTEIDAPDSNTFQPSPGPPIDTESVPPPTSRPPRTDVPGPSAETVQPEPLTDDEYCDDCPVGSGYPCKCELTDERCDDGSLCATWTDSGDVGLCLKACNGKNDTRSCETSLDCDAKGACALVTDERKFYCAYLCERESDCPAHLVCHRKHRSERIGICAPGV